MLLVIDNHDSFTWNLVHALLRWAPDVEVVESDAVSVADVLGSGPRGIVLSPGPGRPEDAGISLALVQAAAGRVPMFGVCLGQQTICAAFGARIVHAAAPMHGRTSVLIHDGRGVFQGLRSPLRVARYHSLVVDPQSLPASLVPTAFSDAGELMAVRHRELAIEAVQFHPESFMTECGDQMVRSFVHSLPALAGARAHG